MLARLLRDAILPLAVTSMLVVFLADPARLDTSELQRNSLLMNTRPISVVTPSTRSSHAIPWPPLSSVPSLSSAVRDRVRLVEHRP